MMEEVYIEGLKSGDQKIFRNIFMMFSARLNYFAKRMLNGRGGTEDIGQNAFVKLWQKREDFDSLPAVKAFLYIAVKNQCLNLYKHEQVELKYKSFGQPEVTDENEAYFIVEAEVLEQVHQAMEKLPEGCRNVLELSYFGEMKNGDIANHLQVSVNTIKTQKKRALHLLRAMLKTTPSWLLLLIRHF